MRLGVAAALAGLGVGCTDTTAPPPPVARIIVHPDSVSMLVSHSLQMTAVLLGAAGDTLSSHTLAWTSGDTLVASVSNSGLVTARAPGTVTITATSDTARGIATLRVLIPVAWVGLSPGGGTLVPGGYLDFTAILKGGPDGTILSDRFVTWTSGTPSVATVSQAGRVTATTVGIAGISASSEGVTSAAASYIVVTRPTFTRLVGGSDAWHTCGLTGGASFCWGDNYQGALGNGTTTTDNGLLSGLPWPTGTTVGFTSLSAGSGFTCAIAGNISSPVYCWGENDHYKLGNGGVDPTTLPTRVGGAQWATAVVTGFNHGCLLATDSSAYCWGAAGGLGNGGGDRSTPQQVWGGFKFTALAAGYRASCGLTVDSLAYCWGDSPAAVPGGLRFVRLTMGHDHTCGIGADSLAYCWGTNTHGQLGDSSSIDRSDPTPVAGAHRFVELAGGKEFTCGLTTAGTAYCWGENDSGQLGTSDTLSHPFPVPVSGGFQFLHVIAGGAHACGLAVSGVAYCWGWNALGQLGDGTTTSRSAPTRVAGQP